MSGPGTYRSDDEDPEIIALRGRLAHTRSGAGIDMDAAGTAAVYPPAWAAQHER